MLQLHIPKFAEENYRQGLLSQPDTMAYNRGYRLPFSEYHPDSGCIDFPRRQWQGWYDVWIGREPERFYAYLQEGDRFVGEVNLYADTAGPEQGCYRMGMVVEAAFRGRGFGAAGLELLIAKARQLGGRKLRNAFEESREAAMRLHLSAGFRKSGMDGGCCLLERIL